MKRQFVLGVLLAMGAASIGVTAWQQPAPQPAARVVDVDKLKDNLYMMRGGGGNSAVFIMADGVTVVDTKNPGWGAPLLEKIKSVTDKPIVRIINTHTHGDHVSGNVEFPATVEVVTHENTAKNMQEMKTPTGITPAPGTPANIFKDNNGKGHAEADLQGQDDDRQGRRPGGPVLLRPRPHQRRRVRGIPGAAHDARRRHLLGQEHPAARRRQRRQRRPDRRHARQGRQGAQRGQHHQRAQHGDDRCRPAKYAAFNNDFRDTVQAGKKAGQTVDQIAAAYKIPERFKGYAAPAEARLKNNVQIVFDETK